MPGGYGTYHNGCAVGVFWDGIEVSADGSQARITNARIKIDRNQNIVDSSNKLTWSGGAITDGSDSNINVDGSGEKTVKSCSETWCDLSYTGTTSHAFDADFSGISYAGTTLTVDKNITYPQRLYNLPAAPAFVGVGYTGSLGNFTVNWVNGSTADAPWQTLTLTRIEAASGATATFVVPNPATATSFDQSGLDPTKRYYWAIAASNSRGASATVYSGTTPEPLHTLSMNYASRAIGEAVTFTIDKHGSSYNSRIRIDDQIAYATGAATSAIYTFSQAPWSSKMSTVTSKSFTVYLDTYTTGGVLIGTFTYSITVTIPNAEPYVPNGDVPTVAETITAISTAFTAGIYIQGYSTIRVTFGGTAGDSATITKKEVIVNGLTYDVTALGYVDIPVTWNTSPTAQSRVTDSRGRVSTSATTVVKGYAYSKPVITNFKAERCTSGGVLANDGTYVKFTINVASTSVNNGVEKNKLNYTVHLAVNGVASGAVLTSKATDTPLTYSGTTGALGAGAYSTSASYSFIITVSDKLASSTTTRIVSIPTEIVPLSIGNNGIAIGKVYDDPTKALDVIGDVEITGNLTVTGTLTLTVTDNNLPARLGTVANTITDWNTAVTNGWYMGNGAANAPVAATWFIGEVIVHNSKWITQEVYAFSSNSASDTKTYRRQSIDSAGVISWGAWQRVRKSEAELDARYAALSHTHEGDEVLLNTTGVENAATSWDAILTQGLHPLLVLGSQPNGPGSYYYFYVTNYTYGGANGNRTQMAVPYSNADVVPIYKRSRYGGVWSAWGKHEPGTDVIGGTLAACNYYEKYANGQLICRGYKSFPYLSQSYTWTFPIAFVGELPQYNANANTTAPENLSEGHSSLSLTSVIVQHYRSTNNSTGIYFSAQGRWK